MAKPINAADVAAYAADGQITRDFLWVTVRDRSTGNPVEYGFWSGSGTLTADVLDPKLGVVNRTFEGAGSFIETSSVTAVHGFVVQAVQIRMSQMSVGAQTLFRTYDLKLAPLTLYRGQLDPVSRLMPNRALARFTGHVDQAAVPTPSEGQEDAMTVTAVSISNELTRTSTATRSDADQKLRAANDGFYRHAPTVGTWKMFWGQDAA